MKIKVTVTREFSEEDVADFFCSAIETSDIHYWCKKLDMEDGWDKYLVPSEILSKDIVYNEKIGLAFSRGAKAILFVDEDGSKLKKFVMDVDDLQYGIQKYLDMNSEANIDGLSEGEWDGHVIDCIFQYILFGKLVYC